jgi:tetratricopeptide (TPR) repeat protein
MCRDDVTIRKVASRHKILLGRSPEVAELEAGLGELSAGRGSLFLLTGEPGIGKTRLADEAARLAAARGVPVHWGRAWEAGGAPAYWPIVQALRSMAAGPSILDALVTASPPQLDRFQLFEAVDAFLRAAAPPPRLMVLDDLHAADPSALQLLHFMVRELRSRPLMVIGTYRDAEARLQPELRTLFAHIAREATVLPLRPLDRGEVAQYVAQATGSDPAGQRVDEIFLQSEGNPLFLREVLQLSGAQARRSEGIHEVVRARLALIPSESRAALEAAAVLGREFAAEPLAAVAGVPELEARARIEPAAHAGLVESFGEPPRWRFTHVLLRQRLYEDLSSERRAALHRAAAAELRTRREGPPLAELAHHLARAVPAVSPVEAAHAAMQAADHAMRLLAFEDALAFYESAQRLLGNDSAEERSVAEAALGAGRALMRMAEVDRGREACTRAAELARRLGDGELFARAVIAGGYEHAPMVRDLAAIARLEEALAMLPPGDGALRARCLAQLAADRQPEADLQPLVEMAREAVAMARRVGDPETLRATLSAATYALSVFADSAERRLMNQEVVRLATAAGDRRLALRAHGFMVGDFVERGDMAGAQPHIVMVESLLREFRHGRHHWIASILRLMESLGEGRFEEAQRRYQEALEGVAQDEARGALLAAAPIAIACVTERYEDVAGLESEVRARFDSLGYDLASYIGELMIAMLHGRSGDRRRAEAQLETLRAHPPFETIDEPSWLAPLTDACHLAGDAKLADRLYRTLLPRAQLLYHLGPLTACIDLPYARHLGLLAETLGRADDAVAHLEAALELASRAGMRGHLARLRYELARSLLARGSADDRARAATLLAEARALATELGQTVLLPRIEAIGIDPPAPPVAEARATRFSLEREGDYWALEWAGRTVRLRDSRGLGLLASLVENAGQELHVLQLASPTAERTESSDAGALLDPKAVQAYRRRLLDLREELDDAEQCADLARAGKAKDEMDFLTQELARAVGLGGRERRAGDAAERARTAVQKRLREAVRKIEDELPELGRHLDQTIHTGIFCGYFPDGRRR